MVAVNVKVTGQLKDVTLPDGLTVAEALNAGGLVGAGVGLGLADGEVVGGGADGWRPVGLGLGLAVGDGLGLGVVLTTWTVTPSTSSTLPTRSLARIDRVCMPTPEMTTGRMKLTSSELGLHPEPSSWYSTLATPLRLSWTTARTFPGLSTTKSGAASIGWNAIVWIGPPCGFSGSSDTTGGVRSIVNLMIRQCDLAPPHTNTW